jgi:ADP-heptose:LPS heptosyltransferase
VAALDLVITVDTSIAHLAAALGKPTWVVLPYAADWRWRPTSAGTNPWYGSIRTFRQAHPGDWLDVFARLGQALTAEIRGITNK